MIYYFPETQRIKRLIDCLIGSSRLYYNERHINVDSYSDYEDYEMETLTIGTNFEPDENEECDWGFQTGDNSYSGQAYQYKHWAIVNFDLGSNSNELAENLCSQLSETLMCIKCDNDKIVI